MRVWHKPEGDPCRKCGQPASVHTERKRSWHTSIGDPCTKCGKPAKKHVSKKVVERKKDRDSERKNRRGSLKIVGIDGEGHDLEDGTHIYTLLCAVDETGKIVAEAENQNGLSSVECFEMLLSLPRDALKFVFMGSYDWTKIIEDCKPEDIYCIMHPETRRLRRCKECKHRYEVISRTCPKCDSREVRSVLQLQRVSRFKSGSPSAKLMKRKFTYALDWMNGSFTVAEPHPTRKGWYKRSTKVWDVFKFFQCSFVKAIELWKVGTDEQHKRIKAMKQKRGSFHEEAPENIKLYCRQECWLLAQKMRKLLDACKVAGIELRRYDGAGAIANALLKREGVKQYMGKPLEAYSKELQHAVMSAYFGGRFENSVIGYVPDVIHNRDIFSAYPYAQSMLPCLECGKWYRTKDKNRVANATLAVIRFKVRGASVQERQHIAWMPLPCRTEDGSICFPTGFEGWAWRVEYDAAVRGWPEWVEFQEAFVYETDCTHKPFGWMPGAYRLRCQWGKDGPGIVMKLGPNACAGKTMQNAGEAPPFKSFIWGGNITGTTRGQGLDGITASKDPWNVLGIATDGLFSIEHLDLANPIDTGTSDLEKPLGGWGGGPEDPEGHYNGIFFVKPGMYYSLDKKILRARGIGRDDLDYYLKLLYDKFRTWDRREELKIKVKSRRFYGARSSVLMFSQCSRCKQSWPGHPYRMCPKCKRIGTSAYTTQTTLEKVVGNPVAYGRWAERDIFVDFTCEPKREHITTGGEYGRLRVRDLGGVTSIPYLGATTPLGKIAREAAEEAMEQPDWSDSDVTVE